MEEQKVQSVQEKPARKGRGRLVATIVIVIAVVALIGFAGYSLRSLYRYESAISLLRDAKYAEAAEAFEALGSYRDAATYQVYSRAAQAGEEGLYLSASENLKALDGFGDSALLATYFEARSYEDIELYESAQPLYLQISLYRDAAARLAALPGKAQERDYKAACALQDQGSDQAALRAFRALNGYKDSEERIAALTARIEEAENAEAYAAADALAQQGRLSQAREAFLKLGDYRDSAARAADLLEQQQNEVYSAAARAEAAGDAITAYENYISLGDYRDSAEKAAALEKEYRYQTAWSQALKGRYSDAYTAYLALGDYKDSAAKAETLWISQTAKLTSVGDGLMSYQLGDRFGLVNLHTNRVTVACYDSLGSFNTLGLAQVRLNSRYGFIDDRGNEVIPLIYRSAGAFDRNGLCLVQNQPGAYGYIDRSGSEIIPCQYEALSAFSGGVCVARRSGLIGLMNTKGEALTEIAYRTIGDTAYSDKTLKVPAFDSEGRLRVSNTWRQYALMDRQYQVLGSFDWDEIGDFHEGLARVKSGAYYGFIDARGEIAVAPEWPKADRFSNGLCYVAARDGRYGYIDQTGELVISAIYNDATRFTNGYAAVCLSTVGWYMIDKEGNNARFAVVPYEQATAAMESGDYAAAAAGFKALGEYGDAYEQMLETYYRQALALRESGDLNGALTLARQLSSMAQYRDSDALAQAVRADILYGEGRTAEAWQLYAGVDEGLRRHQDDYQAMFEAADALLQAEAYDDAIKAFQALGGYGESAARIEQAYDGKYQAEYAAALALMEEKKYDEAIAGFGALGEYSRAQEMALECRYLKALSEEENGSLRTALLAMSALGEYKDAAAQAQRMQAEMLFDAGQYADAWNLFAGLGEAYRTRDEAFAERYQAAAGQLAGGQFDEAEAGFAALGAYQDAAAQVDACREGRRNAQYETALALLEEGKYDAATAGFTALGDYRDSADMVLETAYRKALSDAEQGERNRAAAELVDLIDGRLDFISSLGSRATVGEIATAILQQPAYKDAGAHYCRIAAEIQFDNGEYALAWEVFSMLPDEYRTRDDAFAERYQAAAGQLAAGQFDEAEAGFAALGAYRDAAAQVEACREGRRNAQYEAARALLEEGKYDDAAAGFTALGDYRDSADMVKECAYRHALAMDEAGDTEQAFNLLVTLMDDPDALKAALAKQTGATVPEQCRIILAHPGYKDTASQLCRLDADAWFLSGDYGMAWDIYATLDAIYHTHDEDYQAMYDRAAQLLENKEYEASEAAFLALGGYRDSAQRAEAAVQAGLEDTYRQAKALQDQGAFDEAYDLYASLGSYSDSAEKLLEVAVQKADHLYNEGRFAEAAEVYRLLGASDKALDADWHEADRLYQAHEYLAASAQWLRNADYADSRARNYAMAGERADAQDSLSAIAIYGADPDYEDAREKIYQLGTAAHERQDYEAAVAAWTALGTYKDSGMNLTMDTYAYGGQLYDAKRYDEAAAVFRGMNGFSNTAERAMDSAYQAAVAALEAGDYADAEQRFKALGSYRDSKTMVQEAQYRAANAELDSASYSDALTHFLALGDYKDSRTKAQAARYALADLAYQAGEYLTAIDDFSSIKGYRDAETRWRQARYMRYGEILAAGQFDQAIEGFETLAAEGYSPAVSEASRSHYLKAQALDTAGAIENAYHEYVSAGTYEDAADLAKARAYTLGAGYQEQAQYPEAVSWYEIAEDHADAKAQLTKIGNYYFSVQDWQNAINAYKTLGEDAQVSENLCRIGQYYDMQSDRLNAYLAYGYAGPDSAEGTARAAALKEELTREADKAAASNKTQTAVQIYETLVKIDPSQYPKLITVYTKGFIATKGRLFRIGTTAWKYLATNSDGTLVFIADKALASDKYSSITSWLVGAKAKYFNAQEQPLIASLWVMSKDEVSRYMPTNNDRKTGGSGYIWTSTKYSGSYSTSYNVYYASDGSMSNYTYSYATDSCGIRPALKLKFNFDLCQLLQDNPTRYAFYDGSKKVAYESEYLQAYAAAVETDQLKRYRRAMTLLERGEYDEASAMFTELGDYKESTRMVQECAYQKALQIAEAGDDEAAVAAFTALHGYSDSEAQIEQARERIRGKRYTEADALEREERYSEAYAIFADADMAAYQDSPARAAAVAEKAAEQKRAEIVARAVMADA